MAKKRQLYTPEDFERSVLLPKKTQKTDSRSEFRKDYSRLIHSPCFRRLQGKTQLFPGIETDFFRNRLTHSLEVAQIAHGIASDLNKFDNTLKSKKLAINLDLVEFASIAHDLGHPPFGHVGEEALDRLMRANGGYEGNAQTFRLLTKVEKRFYRDDAKRFSYSGNIDNRLGINPTYRSLASILKYDEILPFERKLDEGTLKAFYKYDEELITRIKRKITGYKNYTPKFKTIECYIMDIADDIAYSTYDLEDSLKANFLNLLDLFGAEDSMLDEVLRRVNRNMEKVGFDGNYQKKDLRKIIFNILPKGLLKELNVAEIINAGPSADMIKVISSLVYNNLKNIGEDGYQRTHLTTQYVEEFVSGAELIIDNEIPALWEVRLKKEVREKVEVLKNFVYVYITESSRLQVPAYRGSEIVNEIYNSLTTDDGYKLLPRDYKEMYLSIPKKDKYRERIICDFIAGMTDRFAIEFYGRMKSESPETIFKPVS